MDCIDAAKKQKEILKLTMELIKIPAISVGRFKNLEGIFKCFDFIVGYLKEAGLRVIEFKDRETIPGLYCDLGRGGKPSGRILFAGHYDRVSPICEKQLDPVIDGDWLRARGATDMLCTVATFMVLLKDLKSENKKFECGLILVGNEEPGETEKWGTPYILDELNKTFGYQPEFVIVGERTGEGSEKFGKLEYKNRGLIRLKIDASGSTGHTAQIKGLTVVERIIEFRNLIRDYFSKTSDKEWKTTFTIPYFIAGEVNNFNTIPTHASAGLEIRPIPEDDFGGIIQYVEKVSRKFDLKKAYFNKEPGVVTSLDDTYIKKLLQALIYTGGGNTSDYLGNGKLHATQARFIKKPVVVFGQSGINPHSENEAHYIPSIIPYYLAMREFLRIA
ncbi:MAG: M20/M25/M40 family metallo-hydrolase [candidate division WOR-3 bacterium]|nr:M20/M25/M40 family metallo-hydrolase [candidate division WOR-3 bacterium]